MEDEHRIDGHVKVYLDFDEGGWRIASVNLDAEPLDGETSNSECECGDPDQCDQARQRVAAETPYPSGQQLASMLVDAVAEHSFHATRAGGN